ncbi:MAG TPA: hypothetical protein VIL30_02600 [Ramlibacter sp.]|jgi:hypothetical protein
MKQPPTAFQKMREQRRARAVALWRARQLAEPIEHQLEDEHAAAEADRIEAELEQRLAANHRARGYRVSDENRPRVRIRRPQFEPGPGWFARLLGFR